MTIQLAKKILIMASALVVLSALSPIHAKTLKLGMGDQMDSDQGAFALRFKELVEHYSQGELKVKLFPGGMLGTEPEMVQNTRLGALDMSLVAATNVTPFAKEFGMLTMPYLISDSIDAVKITTGALGDRWNGIATKRIGVRILGWTYSDFRHLSNSKRPVKNLADLKGLKIRVPQNPIMLETYEAWGANPIAMSWTETFTALQQKVVDGQDNPYIVNNSMKFYEVQDHLTEIHYLYSLQPLFVGAKAFSKMSPEHQQLLTRAGLEAQQYALAYQQTEAENAKLNMQNNGMKIHVLEDESEWERLAKEKVWPKFYESVGGKDVFDSVVKQLNGSSDK